ncbi:MAG TPA: hypothetical protein PKJ33_00590 [Alphaproteobacteria bacterium]|nr:hypothetical protein [Alphaproteobacteria bacterium]
MPDITCPYTFDKNQPDLQKFFSAQLCEDCGKEPNKGQDCWKVQNALLNGKTRHYKEAIRNNGWYNNYSGEKVFIELKEAKEAINRIKKLLEITENIHKK